MEKELLKETFQRGARFWEKTGSEDATGSDLDVTGWPADALVLALSEADGCDEKSGECSVTGPRRRSRAEVKVG